MIIVFDNYNTNKNCQSLWGFSAYFEEYKLLFDTGSNGRILLKNMKELDINIQEIKYIFISHSHWDHMGGLDSILELNSDITLFLPTSLSKHLIKDLKFLSKSVIMCGKEPKKLFDNIYTTGLLGTDMPEQSLIIDDKKESKIITGCGHFGIENITKVASDVIDKEIKFAIGGFHLLSSSKNEILDSIKHIKKLGITKVLPTHCTGDKAIALYKNSFKNNYIYGSIGTKI